MTTENETIAISEALTLIQESPDYRVLKRIGRGFSNVSDKPFYKFGAVLDLETTGLDYTSDEIIEFGILKFGYSKDGTVISVISELSRLRQPTQPIPDVVKRLTGIDDDLVSGQVLEPSEIEAFLEDVSIVIAHNAQFDRPFSEVFCSSMKEKSWACSMSEIDWQGYGFEGKALGYLATQFGYFFDGHRAVEDCYALLELLACSLPNENTSFLSILLDKARKDKYRIWPIHSPYDTKDVLKGRQYKWNTDLNIGPKSWYLDVEEGQVEAEKKFIETQVCKNGEAIKVERLTAVDRFSTRI